MSISVPVLNRSVRRGILGALATVLCALGAIGGLSALPSAVRAADAGPPPEASDTHYVIGPGDTLQVFVWRNKDLSVTVPVRPDGRISTPLVQNMVAVGKTPAELAKDMEQVLSKYLRSPVVNIIVTHPVGALSAVKIIGQVAHPQSLPYHDGMRVLDVVLEAGGLTPFAAGNRAKIVRIENGKTRDIPVKLERLLDKGDMRQNLPIHPGDVLVVPESLF